MRNVLTPGPLLLFASVLSLTSAMASDRWAVETEQKSAAPKSSANAPKRRIPCKVPENASLCYWTHGRLSIYEGAIPYRVWKIGTGRMLSVFSGPSHYPALSDDDIFNPELPREVERAYEADNRRHKKETGVMWTIPPPVFADFEVCPLRPERKAEMQPVCIESAKNIRVKNDD